jgi:hypothetical protein
MHPDAFSPVLAECSKVQEHHPLALHHWPGVLAVTTVPSARACHPRCLRRLASHVSHTPCGHVEYSPEDELGELTYRIHSWLSAYRYAVSFS